MDLPLRTYNFYGVHALVPAAGHRHAGPGMQVCLCVSICRRTEACQDGGFLAAGEVIAQATQAMGVVSLGIF